MTTIKKKYEKPSMMVYRLKTQPQLLAGSDYLPMGDSDNPEETTTEQW